MSAQTTIGLIALREIRVRARGRAFRIATVIQALMVAGAVVASGLIGGSKATTYTVGVSGSADVAHAAGARASAFGVHLRVRAVTPTEAETQVRAGKLDAALLAGTLLTRGRPPAALAAVLQTGYRDAEVSRMLARAHADPRLTAAILDPAPLPARALGSSAAVSSGNRALAAAGAVLLYIALLSFGIAVAGGVVEEKASRIVEIVLSTVTPAHLLAGKIAGIGVLGALQLVLVVGAGLAAGAATGQANLPAATGETAALVVVWFVVGYAMYACGFAAVASLVSRQEDLQGAQTPVMTFLFVGYFLSIGVSSGAPDSTVAVIGTFIPPFAPLIVPARAALGGLPAVQLAGSLALSLVFTAALVRGGGRLYAHSVLRTGAPIRLVRALRELRGSRAT